VTDEDRETLTYYSQVSHACWFILKKGFRVPFESVGPRDRLRAR